MFDQGNGSLELASSFKPSGFSPWPWDVGTRDWDQRRSEGAGSVVGGASWAKHGEVTVGWPGCSSLLPPCHGGCVMRLRPGCCSGCPLLSHTSTLSTGDRAQHLLGVTITIPAAPCRPALQCGVLQHAAPSLSSHQTCKQCLTRPWGWSFM